MIVVGLAMVAVAAVSTVVFLPRGQRCWCAFRIVCRALTPLGGAAAAVAVGLWMAESAVRLHVGVAVYLMVLVGILMAMIGTLVWVAAPFVVYHAATTVVVDEQPVQRRQTARRS